jgi:hypothetical protein
MELDIVTPFLFEKRSLLKTPLTMQILPLQRKQGVCERRVIMASIHRGSRLIELLDNVGTTSRGSCQRPAIALLSVGTILSLGGQAVLQIYLGHQLSTPMVLLRTFHSICVAPM